MSHRSFPLRCRTTSTALATIAVLMSSALAAPADSKSPKDTTTSPVSFTDMSWAYADDSDPCLSTLAAGEASTGHGDNNGYLMEFSVVDQCSGELVLLASVSAHSLTDAQLHLSPNLRSATLDVSAPLEFVDVSSTGATAGTMTSHQTLSFGKAEATHFHSDTVYCDPLQVDPETGDPLPGTTWMRYRDLQAGGQRSAPLTGASGTWTLDLDDGSHYEFITPSATRFGSLGPVHGAIVSQVSGPVSNCEFSYRGD